MASETSDTIKEGDFVFINGGGSRRVVEIKKDLKLRLGRSSGAAAGSLIGIRYGSVVKLDNATKRFVETEEYPDLDISDLATHEEERDNRNLVDDNQNQKLSNEEVASIRREKGLDTLLQTLVEQSSSFSTKTNFAQEKYLKKKQKKYGTLFKIEKVTPDNLAEVHYPTIAPSDDNPEDARSMRLRVDTVALILHHSNIHCGSRVLVYDRTNGLLEGYLLTRIGDTGVIFQVMDRNAQPSTFTAMKVLQLTHVKERWKAVPRNPDFLLGSSDATADHAAPDSRGNDRGESERAPRGTGEITQWVKGREAREMLLEQPADALIVVDDEAPERAVADLFPLLACGGHVVVYSPFLEDLTSLFLKLRNDCVNVRISESWYRNYQVLPQRTHPTVNMSTAAGYLLTAIKVEKNPSPKARFVDLPKLEGTPAAPSTLPTDNGAEAFPSNDDDYDTKGDGGTIKRAKIELS